MTDASRDAGSLEELWKGEFGDAYVERNTVAVDARGRFWAKVRGQYPFDRVLEVGCAHGENLRHLASAIDPHDLYGLDINDRAVAGVHRAVPGANALWGAARQLPFRDQYFDAVFTVALLIHQPPATLPLVMSEIVRCSRRWVMCGEYHADEETTIEWRGTTDALYKRDYGALYQELFPELQHRQTLELTKDDDGFDRVTFHVFERV